MSRIPVSRVPADMAIIARDVGRLVLMASALMAISVLVALGFGELYPAAGFALSAAITAAVGAIAVRSSAGASAPQMKHGMIIAAAGWFTVAVFGSLPFLLTAHLTPPAVATTYVPAGATYESSLATFQSPLHAFFESMSGWTGSGLTMAVHEPSLPRTLQWWRSLMQWVGGVGVIVLTVSILARPGSGSYTLYQSEAREEKIHPSIISTVRTVWKIFVAYTLICILALFIAIRMSDYGASLPLWQAGWQAVNHAMTGLSTGGFSVTDNSIATYDSPLIETVLLPIMTLGAIAFPIHYAVLREREYGELVSDIQSKWLFILLGLGVVALSVQNALSVPAATDAFSEQAFLPPALQAVSAPVADAIRDSTFQWISALTCTGFQSAPIGDWTSGGKIMISGAMVLGGAAGSTVGGIKIIRGYTIVRGIRWQFMRVFLPANAIVTARIGERKLDRAKMEKEFSEAALVTLLWIIMLITSSILLVNMAGSPFDYADALFEVASAQGNVGLSTGITGPMMHPAAETMFIFNMWIGRLEIIPVLVFIRSAIYGLNP